MNLRTVSRSRGFTLIEMLVVMTVIGILYTIALPAALDFIERRRLAAATEQIFEVLQLARTEAIRLSQDVQVSLDADGTQAWALAASTNPACAPAKSAFGTAATFSNCQIVAPGDTTTLNAENTSFEGVTLTKSNAANALTFDWMRRTVTNPTTLTLASASGLSTQITISLMGRTRVCSAQRVGGYPTC